MKSKVCFAYDGLILDGPDNYAVLKKQASLLIRDQKKNLVKILATKPFKERLFLRVFSLCLRMECGWL